MINLCIALCVLCGIAAVCITISLIIDIVSLFIESDIVEKLISVTMPVSEFAIFTVLATASIVGILTVVNQLF